MAWHFPPPETDDMIATIRLSNFDTYGVPFLVLALHAGWPSAAASSGELGTANGEGQIPSASANLQ